MDNYATMISTKIGHQMKYRNRKLLNNHNETLGKQQKNAAIHVLKLTPQPGDAHYWGLSIKEAPHLLPYFGLVFYLWVTKSGWNQPDVRRTNWGLGLVLCFDIHICIYIRREDKKKKNAEIAAIRRCCWKLIDGALRKWNSEREKEELNENTEAGWKNICFPL